MNPVRIVAEREVRQFLHNRQMVIVSAVMAFVFAGLSGPAIVLTPDSDPAHLADQLGLYLVPMIGILMAYLIAGQVFLREKTEKTIETFLCAPVTLRQIWSGKVLGVTLPAYGITLTAAMVMYGLASVSGNSLVYPSLPVMAHILLVVPCIITAVTGLLGFSQLLLGLRENQVIGFLVFFGVVFAMTFTRQALNPAFAVTWSALGLILGGVLVLISCTWYLTRFLSRERIVTTLP
ncbi:MAG: ABC transporter permease subunit [Methanoregulaceae archaeon]|jgi:ABC-2 type transport system permease protein